MFTDAAGGRHPMFLIGGGEMGARIRSFDWSATPLGPPSGWPQSLRSALSICLNSSFPTAIYWGPELRLLYNDAWAPVPAGRHPWALGRRGREVWSDIWAIVGPQFERVMQLGESISLFDQHLPMIRDGLPRETYWNYSFTPIRGEDGAVAGVFNQGNETTAAVLARREAEAEVDRLGRLFAQAPGAVAITRGAEHVFEIVNPAYEELVGRTDVVGRPVARALPEVEAQGFIALLDQVYASGEPHVGRAVPVRLRRGGRAQVDDLIVDFVFQPLTDSEGGRSGVFIVATDVSDAARATAALQESEEFSRSILQSSADCIMVIDLEGAVRFVNESGAALLELGPRDAVIGAHWSEFLPAELREEARSALEAARLGGLGRFSGRSVSARGVARWWEVVVTPVIVAGRAPTRVVATLRDATDRRQAEEARQLLLRELDHRVKNLFAVASAMVAMTARGATSVSTMSADLRGRLGALAKAHQLISPAIDDETRTMEKADLGALLRQVTEPHLYETAGARTVIDGPDIALGLTSATSLALIFHELATNAVKYGALATDEGELTIRWTVAGENLELIWEERVPGRKMAAPGSQGFGSRLARTSASGQLGGGIDYEWRSEGVRIRLRLPLARLSR
ncbi:sensor histidine kinase [Rubrimonas cliftonensis]|nr:PAS domain-containing protein [Rubrimonas cliftonensis]